ncbi:hypothetical protein GCM10023149_39630 [Mucilaginibacter gynuensis]|uniref:HTH marR-type domain-containing protein n=1 Tax=Mucilaginibacter gynuensis TaxID=1302236 RepID=A0ABP8H1J7_9SPHI
MNTQNEDSKRVACKLVYLLKRFTDQWMDKRLCSVGHPGFNNSHLPLLMSIGTTGISNSALAGKLNVTKQATSKVIKELENIHLVKSEKSANDARVAMLYLTNEGESFYQNVKKQVFELEDEYKKVVGVKNYEIAIDVMLKLITFHEENNCV